MTMPLGGDTSGPWRGRLRMDTSGEVLRHRSGRVPDEIWDSSDLSYPWNVNVEVVGGME